MVKKIISRTIKTILLIFVLGVIGHFVYKIAYKIWYKQNSLTIIYYDKIGDIQSKKTAKKGDMKNSKYLFVLAGMYKVATHEKQDKNTQSPFSETTDCIFNEKGEFIDMSSTPSDFDIERGIEKKIPDFILFEGEYIECYYFDYILNCCYTYSHDGTILGKISPELTHKYNVDNHLRDLLGINITLANSRIIGYSNDKYIYALKEYADVIFTVDEKDETINLIKSFSKDENVTILPCYDNTKRYFIVSHSSDELTFYNANDHSVVGKYTEFKNYFRYCSLSHLELFFQNQNPLYEKYDYNLGHYFCAQNDKKEVGYITFDGDMIIDYKYKSAEPFFCGCARVVDMSDKAYFIDINENKVDAPQDTDKFTVMRKLSDSCFFAVDKQNKDTYMIDQQGKILKTFNENEIFTEFVNGYCFVNNYAENKRYIMNDKGEMTVDLLKDVYPKYVNIKVEKYNMVYVGRNEFPYSGLSDSGLFYDYVYDDLGNPVIVFFNCKGEIQFACSGGRVNSVVKR